MLAEHLRKGLIAEQEVTTLLTRQGYNVLTPVSEHCVYDLAVDVGGRLHRVQVKYGRCKTDSCGEYVRFNTHRTDMKSYSGEVDIFAVYAEKYDEVYWVNADDVPNGHMTLRPPSSAHDRAHVTESFKVIPL